MATVLASLGGIGSMVETVWSGVKTLFSYIEGIIRIVIDKLTSFARWSMNLMVKQPEYGIPLATLLIYMLT
jgi:hypothetical protein